ncbi:MAG: helix-turn-helix domain-containing protein [Candidatus Taylorbacteria bacterium]
MNYKDEVARLRAHIQVLEEHILKNGIKPPKLQTDYINASEIIFSIVCDVCKVTKKQILSKARPEFIAWPRQLIMYFYAEYNVGPYRHIVSLVGRTNHATALYAHKKIAEMGWIPGIQKDQFERCKEKIAEAIGSDKPVEIEFHI